MTIWYLSKERSLGITSFNITERNGTKELWVTELNGKSRKLATGKKAMELEEALLDMVWCNFPTIIENGEGKFGTNMNLEEDEDEQYGEEVED